MTMPIAPLAPSAPRQTAASTGPVTSKQWELPPRPKPGRKPGPRAGADHAVKRQKLRPSDGVASAPAEARLSRENGLLRAELDRSRAEIKRLSLLVDQLQQKLSDPSPIVTSAEAAANLTDCGLCDAGGSCVCDELGIKPHPPPKDADLARAVKQFEKLEPMKAVPLKRRKTGAAPVFPFKRVDSGKERDMTWMRGQAQSQGRSEGHGGQGLHSHSHSHSYNADSHAGNHAGGQNGRQTSEQTNGHRAQNDGGADGGGHSGHSHSHSPEYQAEQQGDFLEESKKSVPGDCGFCSHDTPCLCAETEPKPEPEPEPIATKQPVQIVPQHPLSPVARHNERPRPSTPGQSGPGPQSASSPGVCEKCKSDPVSMLFCVALASSSANLYPSTSATISCSDAYETLSRHKAFDSTDLGVIVNSLESENGRVGVQSISRVLRQMNPVS